MSYHKREATAVNAIKSAIPAGLKQNVVKGCEGMFAELYETDAVPDHYVASAVDGVGTKLILAEAMGVYDTIGQDLVAMNANDLATFGQMSPFLFMDYIACQRNIQEEKITGKIIKGIVKGLEMSDASKALRNSIRMNFGKGETASVDELIDAVKPGYGFDVAGAMIGFVPKKSLVTKPQDGDVIIALPSSGPHSNGYTELRHHLLNGDFESRSAYKKAYQGPHKLDSSFDGSTIGKKLLEPTKIYVKEMAAISKDHRVIAINNTGYGLRNLNRLKGFTFTIDNPLPAQPIFAEMQKHSKYSTEQMYTSFNMGMGFFVLVGKESADDVLQLCKGAAVVGSVAKSAKTQTILQTPEENIVFDGYQ